MQQFHGTTVVGVRRFGQLVIGGDGQVSLGNTVMKGNARKVRRLYEGKLEKHSGNLTRAAVELAKDWRTDRALRRLEALLVVADASAMLLLSGTGDVVEPEHDLFAIGSGGAYAQAAARALLLHTQLDARTIVSEALKIAADICVYTNNQLTLEELVSEP